MNSYNSLFTRYRHLTLLAAVAGLFLVAGCEQNVRYIDSNGNEVKRVDKPAHKYVIWVSAATNWSERHFANSYTINQFGHIVFTDVDGVEVVSPHFVAKATSADK